MNIFVFVKQIPVISDIRMNHQTFTVDRSSAGSMVNPADLHAVEAALSLKSVLGGSVTVLTMGEMCIRDRHTAVIVNVLIITAVQTSGLKQKLNMPL